MITYNRPEYTKLSLSRILDTFHHGLKLTIWDNGSDGETKKVIRAFRNHPAIERIIFNNKNDKLRKPTNWFWENSQDAELIGKVDDDCLVPENWCSVLGHAHRDIADAGVLGCWRFFPEDFRPKVAEKKIATFGKHKIMRNCWVEGSGYLMKREVIDKLGVLKEKDSFTSYCIRAATKGYINGWYYPFLYQEHMDDPRSEHTGIRTEEDFKRLIPLSAQNFKINTKDEWQLRLRRSAQRLQECSIDPYDYIGWQARVKRKLFQLVGREYQPRIK